MTPRRVSRRRGVLLTVAIVAAALVGACRESLDSGASCVVAPGLCPGQGADIRDTIIDPVLAFDSTFAGFPLKGTEPFLPLINYGDSLETVAIARFDTLTTLFTPNNDTTQAVLYTDSVYLRLFVDLTRAAIPDSVRIDVYDVGDPAGNPTAVDTVEADLRARFTANHIIGGMTVPKTKLVDSLRVPISDSAMFAHIADSTYGWPRLRVGLRVRGIGGPVAFRIVAEDGGGPMQLRYRPRPDTAAHTLSVDLASADPRNRDDLRIDQRDFTLVLKSQLPDFPGRMMLGGVPGRRAYLRFDIPARLTDSSTVIRATLRLTQVPYPFGGPLDTVTVHARVVMASPLVTDIRRATGFLAATNIILTDSIGLIPADSGVRELEMYPLIRAWAGQAGHANAPPRAVVLTVSNEGTLPRVATFFSADAGAGLRPRMRITYIPKAPFGIP